MAIDTSDLDLAVYDVHGKYCGKEVMEVLADRFEEMSEFWSVKFIAWARVPVIKLRVNLT